LPRSGHNLSFSCLENLPLPAAPLPGRLLLVAQNKKPKSAIGRTHSVLAAARVEAKLQSPFITSAKVKPTETEK
jgi:hypothetical protein